MIKYWSWKYTALYFIFALHLSILRHTVVKSSEVHSFKNESLNEGSIEQIKRENKNQEKIKVENESKDLVISGNKVVSITTVHATVHASSTVLPVEDEFNSTASIPKWMLNIKDGALLRTGYVALGFMSIVLIFFVVRAVRLRQKRSKSRKYGIITSTASDMEMEPLDKDDDEEEDTTLFDAQHKYSLQ